MVDDQELRAIQFLGERIRKATHGCGVWDEPGFTANLNKLRHWNLHLLAEHVIRHAADPKAKTPGVLLGSFTPSAPTGGSRPAPLKAAEQCKRCGGRKGTCACTREHLAASDDETAALEPLSPEESKRLIEQAFGRAPAPAAGVVDSHEEAADVVPE